MSRTKSRFSSAPIAPYRASWSQRRRAARLGKRDAKTHKGIADGTLTQALKEIQTRAQQGQHEVNRWYSKEAEPIIQGNSRISVQLDQIQSEIDSLNRNLGDNGRDRKANSKVLTSLNERKVSQLSQLEMNKDSIDALSRQAEEAIESWERYFVALASIYSRGLSKKLKRDVRSSEAQVPPFESVPIQNLNDQ
jgi:chromosome segregation ATPase